MGTALNRLWLSICHSKIKIIHVSCHHSILCSPLKLLLPWDLQREFLLELFLITIWIPDDGDCDPDDPWQPRTHATAGDGAVSAVRQLLQAGSWRAAAAPGTAHRPRQPHPPGEKVAWNKDDICRLVSCIFLFRDISLYLWFSQHK